MGNETQEEKNRIEELKAQKFWSGLLIGAGMATTLVFPIAESFHDYFREKHHPTISIEKYQKSLINLSATRFQINGIDYLSIPVNGKEVRLFYYNGSYQTADKIKQIETQNAQRQAESNLAVRLNGVIGDRK